MHGLVRARLERRGEATVLAEQMARHPLRLFEPRRPLADPTALLYLGMVGGGILAGDRLEAEIELGSGARALLATQSASKILSMESGCATQDIDFTLGEQAELEYLPDEVIPFAGSSFTQEIRVRMAETAVLVLTDVLSPGRTARGEQFAFRRYRSRLIVERGGLPVLRDVADVRPAEMDLGGMGLLGEHSHYGTLAVVAAQADAALADELHALLASAAGITGSASAGQGLVVARVLGPSAEATKGALRAAWQATRLRLLGRAMAHVPGKIVF